MPLKTPLMLEAEARLGRPLEEAIKEAYERMGNIERAGLELGINENTLYSWMNRLGLWVDRSIFKG